MDHPTITITITENVKPKEKGKAAKIKAVSEENLSSLTLTSFLLAQPGEL